MVKDDNELETHQIKIPACDVKPRQRIEGLTSEQKKLLQTRDRSSEEERWNTMYKICFPNDTAIPSPCKTPIIDVYLVTNVFLKTTSTTPKKLLSLEETSLK